MFNVIKFCFDGSAFLLAEVLKHFFELVAANCLRTVDEEAAVLSILTEQVLPWRLMAERIKEHALLNNTFAPNSRFLCFICLLGSTSALLLVSFSASSSCQAYCLWPDLLLSLHLLEMGLLPSLPTLYSAGITSLKIIAGLTAATGSVLWYFQTSLIYPANMPEYARLPFILLPLISLAEDQGKKSGLPQSSECQTTEI